MVVVNDHSTGPSVAVVNVKTSSPAGVGVSIVNASGPSMAGVNSNASGLSLAEVNSVRTAVVGTDGSNVSNVNMAAMVSPKAVDINGLRIYETPMVKELMSLQNKVPDLVNRHPEYREISLGAVGASLVFYGRRLVVPDEGEQFKERALDSGHTLSGHGAERETYARVKRLFYWPYLIDDVARFVASCPPCQRVKFPHNRLAVGTSTPLIYVTPRYKWFVDYMGPLPKQDDDDVYYGIITFTDAATRLLVAVPVEAFTAAIARDAFKKHIQAPFGLTAEVQVDGGRHFQSVFTAEMEKLKVRVHVSQGNYHQSNGKAEKQHHTLLTKICTSLVGPRDKSWANQLFDAVFHVNSSVNNSMQATPFEGILVRMVGF